ncbi:MAG: DUF3782 domain-containing protein [Magnetococcales bacterium]|nr:DUF3782 domain-containing protein [Magnetococcales bacterium]
MFQETDRKFQETDRKFQETDRKFQETDRKFQETDRKFQETDRKFQETDRKFQEMVREDRERRAELDRKFQETDRQMKETDRRIQETDRRIQETDRQMQETDRLVKEVSRQVGNLGSRWGEFVEGIVAPACETLFAKRGIPVHLVSPRVKAKSLDNSRRMEIDLMVVNTDHVILVEVKSRLTAEDVRDHLKRVREFKEFYKGEKGAKVMGAVAGILIDNDVDKFAMNEGLFVIVQSGDSVKLANDEKFVPRIW